MEMWVVWLQMLGGVFQPLHHLFRRISKRPRMLRFKRIRSGVWQPLTSHPEMRKHVCQIYIMNLAGFPKSPVGSPHMWSQSDLCSAAATGFKSRLFKPLRKSSLTMKWGLKKKFNIPGTGFLGSCVQSCTHIKARPLIFLQSLLVWLPSFGSRLKLFEVFAPRFDILIS